MLTPTSYASDSSDSFEPISDWQLSAKMCESRRSRLGPNAYCRVADKVDQR